MYLIFKPKVTTEVLGLQDIKDTLEITTSQDDSFLAPIFMQTPCNT